MSTDGTIMVRVSPAEDSDAEELAELTLRLQAELLRYELDAAGLAVPGQVAEAVGEGVSYPAPPGDDLAKGVPGLALAGHWLAVQLGALGIGTVLSAVGDWVTRNNRTVEVAVGDSTLKLSRATAEQQEIIINAWLASLPPGS